MIWLLIPYMAVMSGWAGGSLYGHKLFGRLDFMPEVLFSLGFVFGLFPLIGWWALLAAPWSYVWMQTGHANALPWGDGGHNPDRENTLSPVVKWLSDLFKIEYYSINFARLFMAVKGLLITLPVGGLGFILWPLGYEIGYRLGNKQVIKECAAGAGAALSIILFNIITE